MSGNDMIETLDTNTASQIKDADFEMLRKLVYEKSGIRLTPEKKFMVEARLRKRIRELKLQDLDEY
ncbi:MAG: chemotaxis protein CheR, partial [Rhodothermaceae bacterium]